MPEMSGVAASLSASHMASHMVAGGAEAGDVWLRFGCTLPIFFALAWSALTIVRAERESSGQQERELRVLEGKKIISPTWLKARAVARTGTPGAPTATDARRRGKRVPAGSPTRSANSPTRSVNAAAPAQAAPAGRSSVDGARGAQGALSTHRHRPAHRHRSDPLPLPAKPEDREDTGDWEDWEDWIGTVDRVQSAPSEPPLGEDEAEQFLMSDAKLANSFAELADKMCVRLKVSRFELWRNKPVWRSLKQAWQHIAGGKHEDTRASHDSQLCTTGGWRRPVDHRATVTEHLLARMRGEHAGAVWRADRASMAARSHQPPPPSHQPPTDETCMGQEDSADQAARRRHTARAKRVDTPEDAPEQGPEPDPRPAGRAAAADRHRSSTASGTRRSQSPVRIITTPAFERLIQMSGR